jgi:membrane-associated phospholipid phosphatase
MPVRTRPTEWINFGALAVLSLLTVLLRNRLADPTSMLLGYAGLAVAVFVMTALAGRLDRLPAPVVLLVDFYPAVFLPLLFNTLEPLIAALAGGARDDILIAADRAIFGVDVTVWMERFVHPRVNDLFYVFYATYYFFALTLGLILWSRDRATARRYVFAVMACYYVSYAGYFLIPALGPRFAQASEYTVSLTTTPISRTIADGINILEKTKLDVFPSGHTMIAVAVLILAWKRARDTFGYFLFVGTGLIISTVYCRYHYVVDLIAGALLAFVTVPLAERLYDGWMRRPRPSA